MIRLSIIVPLYKSEKYLPKCIESLVQQDIPLETYEIILVNDGSPDNSKTIAEEYASRYSNIKVLSQENKGASGARNTGLSIAVGEYVRFVDPDDYVPMNSFKQFLDQIEFEQLDILRFNYQPVDEQYHKVEKLISAQHIDYSDGILNGLDFLADRLGFACFIWTFIFRRNLISDNNIFFYEGDYYDDTPWTPRVCQKAFRVNSTDKLGYFYYQRSNSLVKDISPDSLFRKKEGQIFLIKELVRQRDAVAHQGAIRWYNGMLAHCTVSLLTIVSKFFFDQSSNIISFLKQQHVFPLSTYFSETKAIRKIKIINISPFLFCWIMHLKNRQ